jgi:hypothetical protein
VNAQCTPLITVKEKQKKQKQKQKTQQKNKGIRKKCIM